MGYQTGDKTKRKLVEQKDLPSVGSTKFMNPHLV